MNYLYFYNKYVYVFSRINSFLWKVFLKKMGNKVEIRNRVKIMSPAKVEIGDNVVINSDSKIGGQLGIKIGNGVLIGYNVNLVSQNHEYRNPDVPIGKQGYYGGPIIIGDDVWLGANVVVLPNITIGKGAIVGANAVVTKNVNPYTVVGGVPARLIKNRKK